MERERIGTLDGVVMTEGRRRPEQATHLTLLVLCLSRRRQRFTRPSSHGRGVDRR